MAIIIWDNRSDGVQYTAPWPVTFQSESGYTPALPYLGIWKILFQGQSIITWQDNADVQQAGYLAPIFYGATGVAAVTNIIRCRGFHRFVAHGMFRRMN